MLVMRLAYLPFEFSSLVEGWDEERMDGKMSRYEWSDGLLEWGRVLASANPPWVVDGAHSTAGIAVTTPVRHALRSGIGVKGIGGDGGNWDVVGNGTSRLRRGAAARIAGRMAAWCDGIGLQLGCKRLRQLLGAAEEFGQLGSGS